MIARYSNSCFICYGSIKPGAEIRRARSGRFVHDECGAAADELARNREQVNGGYTYAGRAQSSWRRGKSPSSGNRRWG